MTREGTSTRDVLSLALLAGGAYIVGKYLVPLLSGVSRATDAATSALANAYVRLTGEGQMIPQGSILLPTGEWVPVANLQVMSMPGSSNAFFQYGGVNYYLTTPHDSNGNWAATTVRP